MHDFVAFIQSNWAQIAANPTAFVVFGMLAGTGGFAVGRYFLTERIANLESRIARRDEEITDLKAMRQAPEDGSSMIPVYAMKELLPPEPLNFNRDLTLRKAVRRVG
jgi:hypothetical protein